MLARIFATLAAVFSFTSLALGVEAVEARPNIVLILADDLGYEALGCNGGTSYATPNLDALAESGVRFEQAYATPLCTPSRVQLMTGKYSFRNYAAFGYLRAGERTFGHLLGAAGYETGVAGKWQLAGQTRRREMSGRTGTLPRDAGFAEFCLWQVRDVEGSRFRDPFLTIDEDDARCYPGEFGPDVVCAWAEEFIGRERTSPFFLYYPAILTHAPFQPTPGEDGYENAGTNKSDVRYFESALRYLDRVVGRLVRALEESGQLERTLFLFVGDNGTDRGVTSRMGEAEVRGRKGYSTSAGTHVPMIAAWPGTIGGGRVSDALVDLTDFLPTLTEVAEVELPEEFVVDGTSLLPHLVHGEEHAREAVFCHYDPRWANYRLQRWAHDREWKLYDSGELVNFVRDPLEESPTPVAEVTEVDARAAIARLQPVLDRLRPDPAPRPPNVIFVLTDDQGSMDMGAYGATDLETPAMDRIAASGLRFAQFYAAAPVCSPSRAALLTGKSPGAAGVPGNVSPRLADESGLPPSEVTIAELLQGAGYRTGHIGKWHLGHTADRMPLGQGFDYTFGHMVGCIDNWSHFFYWSGPNRHDLWRNGEEVFADGKYFPDLMLNEARQFLRENRDRPFFLYFAANSPHYPYQGDEKWVRRYREAGVPYPRDLYNAFVSSLDERVGKLLDEVERLGLREDTIVIMQSDHGHSTEERAHGGGGSAGPYRGAKFSLLEGGIRVPALISWPGHLPEGEVRETPAAAIDWLPTILELCGVPAVEHSIEGASLVPLLHDAAAPAPHETLHWQRGERWAIRRGDWKLLYKPHDTSASTAGAELAEADHLFLVNLAEDVGESTNVAAEQRELVEELTRLHAAWRDR